MPADGFAAGVAAGFEAALGRGGSERGTGVMGTIATVAGAAGRTLGTTGAMGFADGVAEAAALAGSVAGLVTLAGGVVLTAVGLSGAGGDAAAGTAIAVARASLVVAFAWGHHWRPRAPRHSTAHTERTVMTITRILFRCAAMPGSSYGASSASAKGSCAGALRGAATRSGVLDDGGESGALAESGAVAPSGAVLENGGAVAPSGAVTEKGAAGACGITGRATSGSVFSTSGYLPASRMAAAPGMIRSASAKSARTSTGAERVVASGCSWTVGPSWSAGCAWSGIVFTWPKCIPSRETPGPEGKGQVCASLRNFMRCGWAASSPSRFLRSSS